MNVHTRRALLAGTVAMVATLGGCQVNSLDNATGPTVDELAFAPSLGIDLANFQETSSGLLFYDEVVGEGAPVVPGNRVFLAFTGWLPNGTQFDDSAGVEFQIGVGGLIFGFDEGVTNMKAGGIRWIIIPPELGYSNSPPNGSAIPVNSFLVFKMELIEIL